MDKLRGLTYFVAIAEEGSLTQAAHRLEVSVPAVQKMLGALERELGAKLFARSSKGVLLTQNGGEYLDRCRLILDDLQEAEAAITRNTDGLSGNLVVALHSQMALHILLPKLSRFHALYPQIKLDVRTVHRMSDADAEMADVLLLHGWPEKTQDHVHRVLGLARSLIVASPDYWSLYGVPQHPDELRKHKCILMRNPAGILLDLWEFKRDDTHVAVPVNGWLQSNAREVILDAVLGGEGVGRFSEVTTLNYLRSGRLVPVLLDWETQGGPPINLLYKANARRSPIACAFIDFITRLIEDLAADTEYAAQRPASERPAWHRRGYTKASSALRARR